MKVYIAAPWVERAAAAVLARTLEAKGILVQSQWHDKHTGSDDPAVLEEEALQDLTDIGLSEVMIVLNLCLSEGKAVEQGIFMALGRPIIVVGKPSNIFHHIRDSGIQIVASTDEAIALLYML